MAQSRGVILNSEPMPGSLRTAAAIPTHLPDRLEQSADYLPGFAAAPMESRQESITDGLLASDLDSHDRGFAGRTRRGDEALAMDDCRVPRRTGSRERR